MRERTRIVAVEAWECLDSRGHPTVACQVRLADGSRGLGIAPAGASTGTHEVRELRDGGRRLDGLGVRSAVDLVRRTVAPRLESLPAARRDVVDRTLRELDGPRPGGAVGGNVTTAISVATWLAVARSRGIEPFELVNEAVGRPPVLPLPMVNILSGGLHAPRSMDVQDILVMPLGAASVGESLEWCGEVRRRAAALVGRHGGVPGLVADEGGLALSEAATSVGLELVEQAIVDAGFVPGEQVALALDIAATGLWIGDEERYELPVEARSVSTGEFIEDIVSWCRRFPLVSVEDPITDSDWTAWRHVGQQLGDRLQIVGDDLFVTDDERVRRGHREGAANAVLVKPNQTGTISGAEAVVSAAADCGMAAIVSARSGETEQSWLTDLAVGTGAGQIKVGSLTRSERTAKWNRLLELEATHELSFAGAGRVAPL